MRSTSNEEWKAKVLTDFETGSEPDVLFFFTNADCDPIVNAGKVVSIEEIRSVYPDYASNMKDSMMAVAADGNANVTGVVGAVQDTITAEAKGDLFANVQKVVTGQMTAAEAVESAMKLN